MRVTVWSDYLCPWCYLALDREALLVELGLDVVVRPYELHPDVPREGRTIRAGGRTERVFERIGDECRPLGLPFVAPTRIPNTHRTLLAAEHVRRAAPEVFPRLHRSLFVAYFGEGRNIGNPDVVADLAVQAGADEALARSAVAPGPDAEAVLATSMAEAAQHGVTATPAFLFDNGLLVPGVQPRDTLRRWVGKMLRTEG